VDPIRYVREIRAEPGIQHGATTVEHDPVGRAQWNARISDTAHEMAELFEAFRIKELGLVDVGKDLRLHLALLARVGPAALDGVAQTGVVHRPVQADVPVFTVGLPFLPRGFKQLCVLVPEGLDGGVPHEHGFAARQGELARLGQWRCGHGLMAFQGRA
jgi:hypothetical protein